MKPQFFWTDELPVSDSRKLDEILNELRKLNASLKAGELHPVVDADGNLVGFTRPFNPDVPR